MKQIVVAGHSMGAQVCTFSYIKSFTRLSHPSVDVTTLQCNWCPTEHSRLVINAF